MKCNICSSDFVESLDYKSLNNFKSFVCPNQHGEIFFDNDKVSEYILSTIIDNKKVWIYSNIYCTTKIYIYTEDFKLKKIFQTNNFINLNTKNDTICMDDVIFKLFKLKAFI
jgi:hypothetical protein